MASNANTDVDKLITFGNMSLEQGWYDQAREHFEQALVLDASSPEAMKGLARVNEILSRREAVPVETTPGMPVEPIQYEPVEPSLKVERKRSIPEVINSHDERSAGPELRKHRDTSDAAGQTDPTAMSANRRIQYWVDRLYDMSRRNRLLFFKPTKSSTAEIMHPSPTVLFDRLVVKGRTLAFSLPDEVDLLEEDEREGASSPPKRVYRDNEIGVHQTDRQMLRILRNLRTRARTAREEKGVNVLYLAFGFLSWREGMEGELSKAPLVLVPVDLTREALGKPVQLSMLEEDIVVNPTLQVKLRQDFGLELSELTGDLDAVGLEEYWKQVDSLVNEHLEWKVQREAALGIFSFQNLMIVADLERNRQALIEHPLIQALCSSGISLPVPDADLIEAHDLDDRVAPDSVFQVLDADSSQQEAIEAAKAGLSFVLQGPPGTGKSQTIANIIAEFLAKGRRVLFVSQKIAALEVVQRRLEQVGLGEFCLQIHSYRRDKREVVSELGRSLQTPPPSSPPQLQQSLQELRTTRDKLNAYVRALHKPRFELKMSAYHAYGQTARLAEVPQLRFVLPGLENLSPKTHREHLRIVSELAAYPRVIDQYSSHPWMGCRIKHLTLDLRSRLEETLLSLARDIESLQERVEELAQVYAVSPPSTLQEGIELLRVARIYGPEIMRAPVGAIHRRYEMRYQSPFRYVRRSYWRDSALLRDLSRTGVRPDPRSILTALECAVRLQARRIDDDVKERAETSQSPTDLHQLAELAHKITIAKGFISEQFEDDSKPEALANFYKVEYTTVASWCQQQAKHIDKLNDWVNFNRIRQQGQTAGLSSFISHALDAGLEAEVWPETFARGFYTLFIDAAVQSDPNLRSFRGSTHSLLIKQFKELDKAHISLAHHQIRARLAEQRPQASWMKAASVEETILRRELNKKRRLKPLRRLFSEIPELILSLRPCLMMSPLTVSQLLNPELYRFDLVVFDEASQIPPEYAVASFLRGKQVVIAGDRHQLPPTRFFEVLESDVYDDEKDLDEFESILNECDAAGMSSKMLRWHYRSRDESLIAFSNYHFYSSRLLTFPAAHRQGSGTGLEFIHVLDGTYRRGKGARYNLIEARQVVQCILQHFQTNPELSLGVVAFSQAQRNVIEHELERTLRDWPSLQPLITNRGHEPFFVKNLETVQGDERDVIFFSIGYGFDEIGRFLMNFGPLNRAGGERRLNVAVTRARLQVKVIASIQPEDIDLSRTKSRGAQLLRSYMTLARDGVQALYADMSIDPEAEFESPFEASVYEALTDRGLHLHKQVGVSPYRIDLAVVDSEQPGRFLLGIECDGAMYHSADTARDRDRLRQEILEDLGWCIHRIWSRDWIENRTREIEKVLAEVKKSQKREGNLAARRTKTTSTLVNTGSGNSPPPIVTRSVPKLPPEVRPYKKAILRRRGLGAASFHKAPRQRLVEVMQEVVSSEGPIEINVAKRRVAEAWRIRHVGRKIHSALDVAIRAAERQGVLKRRSSFLWPSGMHKPPVRVPQGDSEVRTVEQIALEELAEGAYICAKAALSLDEDDLIKETAWLFGLRATSTAVKRIRMAIRPLIETGQLEQRGGKIRLPHS